MMSYRKLINIALIPIALAYFPSEHYNNVYNDDFPADYNGADQSGFDGIDERRNNFDVETPMEFSSESKPEAEDLSDDQLHASDENSYLQTPEASDKDYASESQTDSTSFLSDGCLRCLCEASSDCDPGVRCHVEGPSDYYCGAFQISHSYWSDAGSPGSDQTDPLDFEECMNEIDCSIDTVNGYMKKWAKDCDGDGRISCDDYAKVHKFGSFECNSTWITDTSFWKKYKDCYFEY